ncbi:MAG: hypothetical protein MP439_03265 [Ferrimicrobium sp.]|jgi:hypothetical protein|nr:hypothetical protein [Ferrimicrobium sp.]
MDVGLVACVAHGACWLRPRHDPGKTNDTGPERATAPVQLGSVGRSPTGKAQVGGDVIDD